MTNEAAGIMVLIVFGILIIGLLLYTIPILITNWQLFTKAGKPGWASIVPVYNTVVMAQIGKKPEWMGWVVGLSFLLTNLLDAIGKAASDSYVTLAFASFSFFINIGVLVLTILILIGYIQQYRHTNGGSTAGFWICYFFVPIAAVFMAKNIVHNVAAPTYPQAPQQPGQQPVPPYVPPVA